MKRAALLLALFPLAASAQVAVLTNHNDLARTGVNAEEKALTPANVTRGRFGMIFKRTVDDQLYTQPLVVPGVQVNGGAHDLVFVTTTNNSVYAFDAKDAANEKPIWHVNFGTPPNLHDGNYGCLDMNGTVGIVGAPVIDEARKALYVVALTRSGGKYIQRLHALDIASGADLPASPVTISAPDFDPLLQNQRPALVLSRGKLFIGYASHCDKLPYHGFLLSYDALTLKQLAVLNTSPGGEAASIWQSGQAPSVDPEGNIYIITGNGSWDGKRQFSESFLKLDPNLHILDWFTPTNHVFLDQKDQDLDSSGASLIPGIHLVLGGGKQGILYGLNTNKLGHLGDENATQHFQATKSHIHSLVVWDSAKNGKLLYVWGQRDIERVYKIKGEAVEETPFQTRPDANVGHPGAMLSLSANGGKDGILWAAIHATGDSWHESRPGILHAYDADDITHELWNSLETPARDNCGNYSKMAPPTIANGMVYLASFGAENIGTGQLCVYGLLPGASDTPAPRAPIGVVASFANHAVTVTWPPVAGAETYTVESTQGGKIHPVASGLTRPGFVEPADKVGTFEYSVTAVNPDGSSPRSLPTKVPVAAAPMPRMDH